MRHFCPRVQQPVVHIDVYHLRTVVYLLAGNGNSLFILLFLNQAQELARTGHVAPFADVEEIVCGAHLHVVQSGKMQMLGARRGTARRHCFVLPDQVAEGFNKPFVRSAAAADDIHEAFFQEGLHLCRHLLRRLTILSQTIGQSGVGVSNNAERALGRQFFEKGQHVGSPEGTVQANGKKREMRHGRKKCSQRLPRERAPGLVCHRGGEDYGQGLALLLHHVCRRAERSLGVERIESRFDDETVHAAVYQCSHLLAVGS